MRAVSVTPDGGLEINAEPGPAQPVVGPDEVLVSVTAAGTNRADLLQAAGLYPPPPGASPILGLECSGSVASLPDEPGGLSNAAVGTEVCCLLTGGGYAEQVAVPVGQVMPIPDGVSVAEAGGLPEVACTVWSNLTMVAGLSAGETLLIHGGGSGIGTCAIQYAKALGARVLVTVGSTEKGERCLELGADAIINYRDTEFDTVVDEVTDGAGADVILDIIGAKYLAQNVSCLAVGGRLVVIGLQGGVKGELNLGRLLARRASVSATSLRFRPPAEKAFICRSVAEQMWPMYADGRMRPVVDAILPFSEAARAHEILRDSGAFGKVILSGW